MTQYLTSQRINMCHKATPLSFYRINPIGCSTGCVRPLETHSEICVMITHHDDDSRRVSMCLQPRSNSLSAAFLSAFDNGKQSHEFRMTAMNYDQESGPLLLRFLLLFMMMAAAINSELKRQNETWKRHIIRQLKTRNRTQTSLFQDIIQSCKLY